MYLTGKNRHNKMHQKPPPPQKVQQNSEGIYECDKCETTRNDRGALNTHKRMEHELLC